MGRLFLPVLGTLLTLVAFILAFVTYILPYWFEYFTIVPTQDGKDFKFDKKLSMMGFWANCDLRNGTAQSTELELCDWFFWDNFAVENDFPDWLKACQGVYGFAVMFEFFMLVLMNLRPYCCSKSRGISIFIGFVLLFVFVAKVAVLILFGKSGNLGGVPQQYMIPGTSYKMGWCPYVSIVGGAMTLLAASAYFALGCKGESNSKYQE